MPRGVGVRVPLSAQAFEDERLFGRSSFFEPVQIKGLALAVAARQTCLR